MGSDYERNRERYFARAEKAYVTSFATPEARLHRMVTEAKSRAKRRGIPFDVSKDDIKWNDVCPVLGIPIVNDRGKGAGGDYNSPSLDKIDNNVGYIKGNVRLISNRANKLKNDMTKEECRLLFENWDKI